MASKIAFLITSTGWGGLEMNTIKLAILLREKNYQVTLFTQEDSTINSYGKENKVFNSIFCFKKNRKYFDFKSAKTIAQKLKDEGINTIMAFDNKDIDLIAWTKKLYFKELNFVYQQHMQIGINKKDLIHSFRFNSIDRWISPLNYLKNEIGIRTRFPADKVNVIPLCLDVAKFYPPKYSKKQALDLLNLKPNAPLMGIVGRIDPLKGQFFLVKSLLKLRQNGINLELLIFGSPTVNSEECFRYNEEIKAFVAENQLEKVVHFVAYQNDVSVFYNAVDLFVLASHSETYGMVTLEAMLSQIPIIATKSGGTSDILHNGDLGMLYQNEDYLNFEEQVKLFIANSDKVNETAKVAREFACKNYAQHIETDKIDLLLKELN